MAQPANPHHGATLRVAFVVGVTPGKWAKVWAERLPRTYLTLVPAHQAELPGAVEAGVVDAALMRMPIEGDRLSSIPLYKELQVVVAPKGHAFEELDAVALADVAAEHTLLVGESGSDWETSIELVAAGSGIAVMPQSVARALGRRDVIARPVTDGPETQMALVWLTTNQSSLVEEFIGIVRGRTAHSSRGVATAAENATAESAAMKGKKSKSARPRTPDRRPSRRR